MIIKSTDSKNRILPIIHLVKGALRFSNPIKIIRNLWHNRSLILQMVRRDVGQRYKGSYMGLLWSVINPLFLLLIYTFVFSVIFKSSWPNSSENNPLGEYAIILFAGMIPFNFFTEITNRAPGLMFSYPNFVKKVVFPLEILPIIAAGSALITSLISVGILLIASLIVLGKVSMMAIFLPIIYTPLILLSLGLSWLLSALGVYFRDFSQLIPLITQILFFLTPVVYPPTSIPQNLQWAAKINPLAMVIANFRNLLIWNTSFQLKEWAIWTVITGFIAVIGYGFFLWAKKGFADVL